MRAALLFLALALVAVTSVSATAYLDTAEYYNTGATDAAFLCVGDQYGSNTTTNMGVCNSYYSTYDTSMYCDDTYLYTVTYYPGQSCSWSAAQTIAREKLACGWSSENTGYQVSTCRNQTDTPLPWGTAAIPAGFDAWVRTSNYDLAHNEAKYRNLAQTYKSDCSNAAYYQEASARNCSLYYASQFYTTNGFTSACDANGTTYTIVWDSASCNGTVGGSISAIQSFPFKCDNTASGFQGVAQSGIYPGACANPVSAAQVASIIPAYEVTSWDGSKQKMVTVRDHYSHYGCDGKSDTDYQWTGYYSNACVPDLNRGSGSQERLQCRGNRTTLYLDYQEYYSSTNANNAVQFCNTTTPTSARLFNGTSSTQCYSDVGPGYSSFQCVLIGDSTGSASSVSVSFVAMFVAALFALVVRQ